MRIKHQINSVLLFICITMMPCVHALEGPQRSCLILVDQRCNVENIGNANWFLTSRLQSAIAEQATPILLNAGLWNSFIERRIQFRQSLEQKDSSLNKMHELYRKINEHIECLSHQYNDAHPDVIQNKHLVVQSVNEEFYHSENYVTAGEYQILVDYYTPFDPKEWDIYKNAKGFYLFIPKKYSAQNKLTGFNIQGLEEVVYPEDSASIYFDSLVNESLPDVLSDFFLTHSDFTDSSMPYAWDIVLAGHGGSHYKEKNLDGNITWNGQPLIADLTVDEFREVLDFFHSKVKTHLFHYSSCYGGGNHIELIFNQERDESYNYGIICGTLTDTATYCKWTTLLSSSERTFLTTDDLVYDATRGCSCLLSLYIIGESFLKTSQRLIFL